MKNANGVLSPSPGLPQATLGVVSGRHSTPTGLRFAVGAEDATTPLGLMMWVDGDPG